MPERLIAALLLLLPAIGTAQDASIEKLEEQAFKAAAEHVAESVIQLQAFGGLDRVGGTLTGTGPTTGVVVSSDGYVISSAFAFASKPAAVVAKLPDGRQLDATIVATDYSRMLTLLKINETGLVVPEGAPLDQTKVGQWTLAVGKAFDARTPNASAGVLSAKNRIWGKAVQTDAKVSPFNYGGPLIDLHGRVIGIIVPLSMTSDEVMAGAEWYDSGIGFAVPFEQVLASVERLKTGEDLYRGVLGVVTTNPGQMFATPVVGEVREDSPAAEAGLAKGDVIVEVDGKAVTRQAEILQALGPKYAGDVVEVRFKRGDDVQSVSVTLEKPTKTSIAPEQKPAEQPGDDEPRQEGSGPPDGRDN